MPNFSGIWNATEQFQARAQNIWPATPGAPTIGTATAGTSNCASVTFTAPGCTGRYPAGITNYTAISTPGCVTVSGASSPVVVTGLTTGTSYTFRVRANGANGSGPLSAASNSITAAVATCATFTTPGTFSWVAPAGVTSISLLVVGAGGSGGSAGNYTCCGCTVYYGGAGGGGGGLAYQNSRSVTPGSSYTVRIFAGGCGAGNANYFESISGPRATNGFNGSFSTGGSPGNGAGVPAGQFFQGGAGGSGGIGVNNPAVQRGGGGGSSPGYSGCGVAGGTNGAGNAGNGGSGGSGGGGFYSGPRGGGGGGGIGIFGAGSSGAAGAASGGGGGAGSGGSAGSSSSSGVGAAGGVYGGGGGGGAAGSAGSAGGGAVIRIVWAGGSRGTPSFPSTNVGP